MLSTNKKLNLQNTLISESTWSLFYRVSFYEGLLVKVFCGTVSILMVWTRVNNHKRFWKQQQFRYQSLSVHLLFIYSNIKTPRNLQILLSSTLVNVVAVMFLLWCFLATTGGDSFSVRISSKQKQRCKDIGIILQWQV